MITRVEATNFRCLRHVRQDLRPFQVLVGPNSSGKSAFLDVISFIADFLVSGLEVAIARRTSNFHDLTWGREGCDFRLVIEAEPPAASIEPGRNGHPARMRYELGVRLDPANDQVVVDTEQFSLGDRIVMNRSQRDAEFINEDGSGQHHMDFHPGYSGLPHVYDPVNPGTAWLKDLLLARIRLVELEDRYLRAPSPPGQVQGRHLDGLSLARSVFQLAQNARDYFAAWIRHVQTALPDVETIKTVLRSEDQHRYLMVRYRSGIEVPSWMLSGGTLRLLALTLLAYIPDFSGVYLIEEPEIGVHPTAIETIVQSLSSVYSGQVLLTSHSPLLLSLSEPRDLLCFQRTDEGTQIIPGDRHPMLRDWRAGVNISDLFAAGVLG